MAKNKGGQYTANIYVPDSEADVREWLTKQDSASKSMRALIHWAISQWGMEDIFVAEFARTAANAASQPPLASAHAAELAAAPSADSTPKLEPKKPEKEPQRPDRSVRTPTDKETLMKNWRHMF